MSPKTSRVVILVAALAAAGVTARLGVWQLDRGNQKRAMQAALAARAALPPLGAADLARTPEAASGQHYRAVRLAGRWRDDATVWLDNRPMDGRSGFIVATPLLLEGEGGAVLVQRGWVPRDAAERTRLPPLPPSVPRVEVLGTIAPPPGRLYDLGAGAHGPIRQNLDLDEFARETRLALRPLTVLQADSPATAGDGLRRHWPPPALDVAKHDGYAFQWFALCALILGLYVWFQLIRPRHRP
jgi:surfeit locus 1 family protein